jgi:MFS family permease
VPAFLGLLRDNSNYRKLWIAQVVSEVGDHFNSIACLSLTLHMTGSGLAVGGTTWLLWLLSALLMFASPFFSSGRAAILPSIATPEQLHTANALTQTTSWLTLTLGTLLGGTAAMQWGYEWAFVANALSFLFSAGMIFGLRAPRGGFRAVRTGARPRPWRDLRDGLGYMRRTPLVLAIGLAGIGWASGGGAAQILFTLFGELVFKKGPAGIGLIWGFAGVGLVLGGLLGHRLGVRLGFAGYKHTIAVCFTVLGVSYMLFSVMPTIGLSLIFITLSRVAMGVNNVLNRTALLTHVPDAYRGRVFSTVEALLNVAMTASVAAAGIASHSFDIRAIGVAAGALSGSTAIFWTAANLAGWLPEPARTPAGDAPAEPAYQA